MPGKVRRIVTGVNAAGRSHIVSDTLLPTATIPAGEAVRIGLWTTEAAPSSNKGAADPVPDGSILKTPPAHKGGSVIRITDIAPDSRRAYDPAELRRRGCKTTPDRSARHPGFHATDTIDYAVCLEGERHLVLEEDDVLIRAGDVVIQLGNWHSWENRSGVPVLMSYVMIGGEFAA